LRRAVRRAVGPTSDPGKPRGERRIETASSADRLRRLANRRPANNAELGGPLPIRGRIQLDCRPCRSDPADELGGPLKTAGTARRTVFAGPLRRARHDERTKKA